MSSNDAELTITLDQRLEKALERAAKQTRKTKTAFARDAIRRHIAVMRYRELRLKIRPLAQAQGLFTDEDCFRAFS